MAFSVVLGTCVLYPAHLRDALLRLAERDLYRAQWSADIVEELRRSLIEAELDAVSVDHLIAEMVGAFPDATVERGSAGGGSPGGGSRRTARCDARVPGASSRGSPGGGSPGGGPARSGYIQ